MVLVVVFVYVSRANVQVPAVPDSSIRSPKLFAEGPIPQFSNLGDTWGLATRGDTFSALRFRADYTVDTSTETQFRATSRAAFYNLGLGP